MKSKHPYHDESMWKGAPNQNFALAKQLRDRMTEAEVILWEVIKSKKFNGYKFRRQHPIHQFIVDFYCHELKLIIEIDGKYHESEEQKKLDLKRSDLLQFQGLTVLRFTNEEVISNIVQVLKVLENKINSLPRP